MVFDGPWETCMLVRGLDPGQCASWVQAWGAILAIFASAMIVFFAQRAEARRELAAKKAEETRLLQIVGMFVFEIRAKLRDIDEEPIPYLHRKWTAIDEPIASLRAIPFDKYPDERPAFAVATALTSYRFLRDASDALGTSAGPEKQASYIDASRQHALGAFFRAEQELETALVDRGSKMPRKEIGFGNGVAYRTLEAEPV